MKNLRTVTLTVEDQASFDPATFSQRLMEAGFSFDHLGCPYKITKPWDRVEHTDGTVTYRQWTND